MVRGIQSPRSSCKISSYRIFRAKWLRYPVVALFAIGDDGFRLRIGDDSDFDYAVERIDSEYAEFKMTRIPSMHLELMNSEDPVAKNYA